MKEAASLWAEARIQGMPTADDLSLDADVIICAQYKLLAEKYPGRYIVIATTNVRARLVGFPDKLVPPVNHLSRFAEAKEWQEI